MIPNVFRDAFARGNFERKDDLVQLFQNEYRQEYDHLRKMGTPINQRMVKQFLKTQSL